MILSSQPIRILAVDDHPLLLEGIAALIASQADMLLVAQASTGREAIDLFRTSRPDVTLMDLRLPDLHGVDVILIIRSSFPDARILVLTTYFGDTQAHRALEAGAYGYLLKSTLRRDLLDTIRAVHAGQKCVPAFIGSDMVEHALDDALTPREIEVIRQAAAGKSNKLIADHLKINEDTVKTHMRSILAKLSASDRTHAVTIALRRGYLDL